MTDTIDPGPWIQWGGAIFAVLAFAAALVVPRLLRLRKAPPRPEEAAPTLAPVRPCPCGGHPTRPLPRAGMWQIPIAGRWWYRVKDGFGEAEVCDGCGRFADAAFDEHLAATVRLAHARMEREIAREMAGHERALMAAVLEALPEEARKEHARRVRLAPKRAAGDEGEGG